MVQHAESLPEQTPQIRLNDVPTMALRNALEILSHEDAILVRDPDHLEVRGIHDPSKRVCVYRRDVLPGSDGTRQSPMEKLGAAYWKFEHGLLDKAQLEHVLELTRLAERTHKTTDHEGSSSYA